jgi:hypothetical protein
VNNCFFWAIAQWYKHGGYVVMRKSHYGNLPHFLWLKDFHSKPLSFVPNIIYRYFIFPKLLFRGHIQSGDEESEQIQIQKS